MGMPVYEYEFLACNARADESQPIDQPHVVFCKRCEAKGETNAMLKVPSSLSQCARSSINGPHT